MAIQDLSFYTCGNQSFDDPDLVLVKMDRDFHILWANTICGTTQDGAVAMELSKDNYLYLATEHLSNGYLPSHQVNFFNQDTAYFEKALFSVLKIDSDGNIIWRKEIKNMVPHMYAEDMFIKPDSNIVFKGCASCDLLIDNDTLFHPVYPEYTRLTFLVTYNPSGECSEARFINLTMTINELSCDEYNNIYFHGYLWEDTPVIFGDEIIMMEDDTLGQIMGKMDPALQPDWYYLFKSGPNQQNIWVGTCFKDDIYHFAITTNNSFTFAGIDFSIGNTETITGFFNVSGELENYSITETDNGLITTLCQSNNCKNLICGGAVYQGNNIFGTDTLYAASNSDFLAAKLDFYPDVIDLGPDTAVCEDFQIEGPTGYEYYCWNDTVSGIQNYLVTQSGMVTLSVSRQDGCWAYDTVFVEVFHYPAFNLGNDTTILLTDTLSISVPSGYKDYLWSTGDTGSSLVVPATALQTGNNIIWVDIGNGPCSASDTIIVNVIDNSIIQENILTDILLYPNPAETSFRIISRSGELPKSIVIYNCDGKKVMKPFSKGNQFDINGLEQGVYIVELEVHEFVIMRKLIIL